MRKGLPATCRVPLPAPRPLYRTVCSQYHRGKQGYLISCPLDLTSPETLKPWPRAGNSSPSLEPLSPFLCPLSIEHHIACNAQSSQKPNSRNSRAITLCGSTSLCPGFQIMSTVFDQWLDNFQVKYISLLGACYCVSVPRACLACKLSHSLERKLIKPRVNSRLWCCPYGRAGQVSRILGCWKLSVYSGGSRAVFRDSHPQA